MPDALPASLPSADFPTMRSKPILSPTNSNPPAARVAPIALARSPPESVRPSLSAVEVRSPKISPPSIPTAVEASPTVCPIFPATLAVAVLVSCSAVSFAPCSVAASLAVSRATIFPATSFAAPCNPSFPTA